MEENKKALNYDEFIHPADAKTLAALKKVPLFDKFCSKFISIFTESISKVYDMSSKLRITDKQMPELNTMLVDICGKLDIEIPAFYLELNPYPNAYTYGDKSATVVITSGLIETFTNEEIYTVIAHECGHIACKHVLYSTMAQMIISGGEAVTDVILGDNFITKAVFAPIKLALYHWYRCSELSADRIAAICCGSTDGVVKVMAKFCGAAACDRFTMDYKLFATQAAYYNDMLEESKVNKLIEYMCIATSTHPMPAVRAYEITEWGGSDTFNENVFKKSNIPGAKKVGFFARLFSKK